MKKKIIIILGTVIFLSIVVANIFGRGWIFYHDGPYKGKVVDADTGEPIVEAAVVGEWSLELYGGPAGPISTFCDAQETVTDKNGEFIVPKASCFHLWPFTKLGIARFNIFKPGFDSYPPSLPVIKPSITTVKEREEAYKYQLEYWVEIYKQKNNLIRLKKVKNREEREWVLGHISLSGIPDKKLLSSVKKMVLTISEEEKYLGRKPTMIEVLEGKHEN